MNRFSFTVHGAFIRFLQDADVKTALALILVLLTAGAASAGQRLNLDRSQSHIDVQVQATMDSFTARLSAFDSDIIYDRSSGRIESASLAFRFEDVKTGKDGRDREMNEWQQTEQFPVARFQLTELAPLADGRHQARGTLTLHGVTRDVEFPVVIAGNHTQLAVDGEARIDTRDFDLKVIRKFALLKVQPEVVVRFHLQGRLDRVDLAAGGGK